MYIVGFGETLWDLLPEGKQLGGAPANFAYHVSQLGCPGCVVSAVGKDGLGQEILNEFGQRDLHYLCNQVDFPTGTVAVTLDAQGVPSYEIKEEVAWDAIPFTRELTTLAQETQAICFGTLAQRHEHNRKTLRAFLDFMPEKETYKVFDINLRQHFYSRELIEESLEICNILKINDEELETVRNLLNYPAIQVQPLCQQLLKDYALEIVILTCGEKGSSIFTAKENSFLPTPKVEVVDTVGAGDAFTAAFVAALLQGKDLRDCHRLAVDVSAYVCTQHGAMPVLPPHLLK